MGLDIPPVMGRGREAFDEARAFLSGFDGGPDWAVYLKVIHDPDGDADPTPGGLAGDGGQATLHAVTNGGTDTDTDTESADVVDVDSPDTADADAVVDTPAEEFVAHRKGLRSRHVRDRIDAGDDWETAVMPTNAEVALLDTTEKFRAVAVVLYRADHQMLTATEVADSLGIDTTDEAAVTNVSTTLSNMTLRHGLLVRARTGRSFRYQLAGPAYYHARDHLV